jgi:hypothetical protein
MPQKYIKINISDTNYKYFFLEIIQTQRDFQDLSKELGICMNTLLFKGRFSGEEECYALTFIKRK